MGPPHFPLLLILAFAGLPDEIVNQINQFGWFLPFLVCSVPVGLIAALTIARVGYFLLGIVQLAAIIGGTRTLAVHLKRQGVNSYQIRVMIIPFYLVVCFFTNIFAVIAIGIARKFF